MNDSGAGSIRAVWDIDGRRLTRAIAHRSPAILLGGQNSAVARLADAGRLRSAFEAHFALVWRSLRRFGVAEAKVDDALQHVFLAFSSRLSRIAPESERSFLLSTAVRVAANARRRDARSPETPSDQLDGAAPEHHTPEELLDWKQRREALDRALDGLPLEQRAVFVLFELEGFSLPEIAKSLGIPLGTATSRLRRARSRFEAWATRWEGGEDP